jgi:1,4-dihydroxy-2-naphthoate octaprenyltransferase
LLWGQIPVSALLGVAFNLANSLPDIQEDIATQENTLAVRLGLKRSLALCSLLVLLAAIVIGVLTVTGLVPVRHLWLLLLTLFTVLPAIGILHVVFSRKETHGVLKIYFYIFTVLCLLLGIGWIASVLS